jgi:hydroxypyruvate isomerase
VRTPGLRFDVNCSILFTELPLLKRPEAARAAGFGCEYKPPDPADSSASFGWREPHGV